MADNGSSAFVQRQRLLAMCGWETRVMPFSVGGAHASAAADASASGGNSSSQQPAGSENNCTGQSVATGQQVRDKARWVPGSTLGENLLPTKV